MGPAASTVSPVRMLVPCPFVAAHRRAWRAPARVGDYRALYEVNDEVVTVVVAKVGHGATRFYGGGDGANSGLFLADFQADDCPRRIDRLCCAIEFRS